MVLGEEVVRASRWRPRREGRAENAVAVAEAERPRAVVLDRVAALVDEAVVVEAEQYEVLEARLAAVRPMLAVVCLEVAAALAAGEAAGLLVARLEQTAKRRRHRPPLASDAHRQAVSLDLGDELRVAAQPPRRLGRDDRAVFELGAPAAVRGQRVGVNVHDDLRALDPLHVGRGERRLGQVEQGLHLEGARRLEVAVGRAARLRAALSCGALLAPALDDPLPRGFQRLDEHRAVLGRKAGAQVERAVVVEVVVDVLELVRLARVGRRDPTVDAKRALELRRRKRPASSSRRISDGRGRDPRQRAHLRESELAASERRPSRGQLLQRLCDPHVLACLAPGDPAAPGEEARQIVADARLVELRHALEPPSGRGAQMGGERRELVDPAPLLLEALLRPLQTDLG